MSPIEAVVLGLVVAACVALWRVRGTLHPTAAGFVTALALVAVLAVVLRRCGG
jgi:hypothetical protein